MSENNLKIQPNKASLIRYATERIVRIAQATLEVNERFSIALAGGSTPGPVYEMLGEEYGHLLDWSRIHLFWGDERCVPPDDAQSNYRLVKDMLLRHVEIPDTNLHRMRGEDKPEEAAAAYAAELQAFFQGEDELFDLMLLGMGDDGHTASLFPGTAAVHEQQRWVIAHYVEAVDMWRLTLTPPAILKSSNIMFLIAGEKKAKPLYEVLHGTYQPLLYPSQVIARQDHEHVVWVLDEAAAANVQ